MKVQINDLTPTKKTLTIEIPQEIVSQAFSAAYTDLNRKVKVPGFRPGKVPLSLLEKRYGGSVRDDIVRELIPDYYQKAIKEAGISPVEFPAFDQVVANKNEALTFTATVEVRPKIVLSKYKELTLPQKEIEVTKEEIEKALLSQQDAQGHLEACDEGHSLASLDYAIINFEGAIEGKSLKEGRETGYMLQVGSETFPPPFESSLIGKKRGEALEVDVPYPDTVQNKEIAGKTIHFKVEIEEIKKKVLPALDDEFAKDLGHENLEAFREVLKQGLLQQKKTHQKESDKKALLEQLLSSHPFEVPVALVARELNSMMGSFPDQSFSDEKRDALLKDLEPLARRRVQESLILDELAKKEELPVSEQELDAELEKIAERRQSSLSEVKRLFYKKEGAIEGLRAQIKEQKALDLVYASAKFEKESEEVAEKGEKS